MTKIFSRYKLKPIRKILRGQMTKSEAVLWKKIKNDQLGFHFRRQHSIHNYVVDFYCPKLKLAIEIDGCTHDDEKVGENDIERQKYLECFGIRVVRFNSQDILKHLSGVLETLYSACEIAQKLSSSFQEEVA